MGLIYQNESAGILRSYTASGICVPFGDELGPSFFVKNENGRIPVPLSGSDGRYAGELDGIRYTLSYADRDGTLSLRAGLHNTTNADYTPELIGLELGIDTYMVEYPQWNDVFFPTLLRCEKTHFWGYFMSPTQNLAAVSCAEPVAAWALEYNTLGDTDVDDFGHRIYTADLLLVCRGPLPARHPQQFGLLPAGASYEWEILLTPMQGLDVLPKTLLEKHGIATVSLDRYTLAKGETAHILPTCADACTLETRTPSGDVIPGDTIPCREYGVYTVTMKTGRQECEAQFYCRHPYDWYLKQARKNAVTKPQKASTHTESWYGHFSSFLAKKHFPDPVLDAAAQANFDEILPLMYDLEAGQSIVAPTRIQNAACLVSLLVDAYEADPDTGRKYLDWANNMAADLLRRQSADGAYRNRTAHYTAVIYIAKSILELALCEKTLADDPEFRRRYELHYASVRAAVDDLCRLRETIGTEGEHTLEDGMISCACLQLGYFALTLPELERAPYIEAAEHLLSVHRCLEQMVIPDCRMHGATLRFWEAQYDVLIRGNMMNSPHGWTSWKNYATYYLYLLTGKEEYLRQTMDTMGACLQMIDENGELRWAFVCDPYLNVKRAVPDLAAPVTDGYESAAGLQAPAYRAKYEQAVFGECYIDMISGWYRNCPTSRVTGGYELCPLILEDRLVWGDNQGGCCDNDVHEHFKCLEETVFGKAFVLLRSDGSLLTYNCAAELDGNLLRVTLTEFCSALHVNTPMALTVCFGEKTYAVPAGMTMIE